MTPAGGNRMSHVTVIPVTGAEAAAPRTPRTTRTPR
jgi:hypothetical protein